MLVKWNCVSATVGWLLARRQAEAFSVVGFQKPQAKACRTRAFPSSVAASSPTQRILDAAALRGPSRGLLPLHMLAGGDAVQSSVGTKGEEHSVLDALIDQFTSPKSGNVTATVEEYLDLCDHALLTHLRGRIEAEEAQSPEATALTHVEEEINMAMQRRLAAADSNLRQVLDLAPDIKKMEGRIRTLFREGKVNMAFMVMISMNLQRAKDAEGADHAVMLLTHLTTFIMMIQDERLNPEEKLLRTLLRTDCDGVRKSILQDRLQLPNNDVFLERPPDKDKVQPHLLQQAINDMITQVEDIGQAIDVGMTDSLKGLQVEVNTVVAGSKRPGPYKQ
ncbi:unnamed protein product [Ectocarpus sp. 12 AP-2014]